MAWAAAKGGSDINLYTSRGDGNVETPKNGGVSKRYKPVYLERGFF